MTRRVPPAAALAIATTGILGLCPGCGTHRATTSSSTAARSAAAAVRSATVESAVAGPARVYGGPAALLVLFKRVVGFDPLSSQLVVDQNGAAAATITLGGIGGQKRQAFRLTGGQLGRLRHLLVDAHLRDATCCANPGYYTYLVITRGHSWQLFQRGLPRAVHPLIGYLNAIIAAHSSFS